MLRRVTPPRRAGPVHSTPRGRAELLPGRGVPAVRPARGERAVDHHHARRRHLRHRRIRAGLAAALLTTATTDIIFISFHFIEVFGHDNKR